MIKIILGIINNITDNKDNIPDKYLNSSARNIKNKKRINFFKKYIRNFDDLKI